MWKIIKWALNIWTISYEKEYDDNKIKGRLEP